MVGEEIAPGEVHLHLSPSPGWRQHVGLHCFSSAVQCVSFGSPKAVSQLLLKIITLRRIYKEPRVCLLGQHWWAMSSSGSCLLAEKESHCILGAGGQLLSTEDHAYVLRAKSLHSGVLQPLEVSLTCFLKVVGNTC